MRMVAALALAFVAFVAHAGEERHFHKYRYMVRELGAPEDLACTAHAVSQNGRYTAGAAWHGSTGDYQAALFQRGFRRTFILAGRHNEASGVNDDGEVVGSFWNPAEGEWLTSRRAFLWRKGVVTPLPTAGSGSTVATAINNAGTVVGWFHAPSGAQHGFSYRNGVLQDLGTWGAAGAEVTSINGRGDLAGARHHAIEPAQEAVRVRRGEVEPLGRFFPGLNSVARAINRRGDVAGYAFKTIVETEPVTMWPFAVFGKEMRRLLPDEPGWSGFALGINSARQVVGAYAKPGAGQAAFLWEDGRLIDLSSLPEVKAAGWLGFDTAIAINDDGVIVGSGVSPRNRGCAFMLIPLRRK